MSPKKLSLRRSGLEHHRQIGKELVPPFQQIGPPMVQIQWFRDMRPEFLWIEALVVNYGQPGAVKIFNYFLSSAESFNSDQRMILDGPNGAFSLIAEDRREYFLKKLAGEMYTAI